MSDVLDFPDVLADADFIRDWRRDHPMPEAVTRHNDWYLDFSQPTGWPRLAPLEMCFVCGRREEDQLVDFEGAVRGICSTCFERGQDELPRGDADDEC